MFERSFPREALDSLLKDVCYNEKEEGREWVSLSEPSPSLDPRSQNVRIAVLVVLDRR
jgi:hypothetical protein